MIAIPIPVLESRDKTGSVISYTNYRKGRRFLKDDIKIVRLSNGYLLATDKKGKDWIIWSNIPEGYTVSYFDQQEIKIKL